MSDQLPADIVRTNWLLTAAEFLLDAEHSFYPKEASQTHEAGNLKVHIVSP